MKASWIHVKSGKVPRQARVDIPPGLREEHVGRQGFSGPAAMLYHRSPPTQALRYEGALIPLTCNVDDVCPSDFHDEAGSPLRVLENGDVQVLLSRRTRPMPYCLRNIDADTLYFVHRGTGVFATEFGPLTYRPGDFIHVPKGLTYRHMPQDEDGFFVIYESAAPITFTEHLQVGRHAPFDPTVIEIPQVTDYDWPAQQEWELRHKHGDEYTSTFYAQCPMNLAGWKGDLFPHRLNIEDIRPITSERIHVAPSSWSIYESSAFMLVAFLPMSIVSDPLAEELPDYHRNIDSDEAIFVHLDGRRAAGTLVHSPQGVTHGPSEQSRHAFEAVRRAGMSRDFVAVSLDTYKRLNRTAELKEWAKKSPARPGKY
jgi:homogentisate 1,2-dioxygenase